MKNEILLLDTNSELNNIKSKTVRFNSEPEIFYQRLIEPDRVLSCTFLKSMLLPISQFSISDF